MTEEPKRMTAKDWMAMEVSEEHATSVANMTDEKLMTAYLVNGMLAAVAGEGSLSDGSTRPWSRRYPDVA